MNCEATWNVRVRSLSATVRGGDRGLILGRLQAVLAFLAALEEVAYDRGRTARCCRNRWS